MIACGQSHCLYIDPDGLVWASGGNNFGQLGLGHNTKDYSTFCQITDVPCAVQVASTQYSSSVLDHEGDVWMFGWSGVSQIGVQGIKRNVILSPIKVQDLPKIVMVCCGYEHRIVLDVTGCIWAIGNISDGQLGSDVASNLQQFTQINTPAEMGRVVKIACGSLNTIAQNEADELWGTGQNVRGGLGVGHNQRVNCFQKMISLKDNLKVQSFDCGSFHTGVLDNNGGVWTTGCGYNGQFGLGFETTQNILTKMPGIPPMIHIACGAYSTLMLDENGRVYTCGYNANGELGAGHYMNVLSPLLISGLPQIVHGSLSNFSVLVDHEGGLWVSGSNKYGQHGTGNVESTNRFVQVDGIKVNVMSSKKFHNTKRAQ